MSERERQLEEENRRLREENRLLREKVDLLVRKVFGASSEKLDANQLLLLDAEARKEDEACAVERPDAQADEPGSERHHVKKTPRLPEDLPVEERFLDPEEVTESPQRWRCIGSEVSEQLDYRPGRFCRVRLVRRKYAGKKQRPSARVPSCCWPGASSGCASSGPGSSRRTISRSFSKSKGRSVS